MVNATTITAVTAAGGAAGAASVLVTTPGGTNAANTLFTWTTPSLAPLTFLSTNSTTNLSYSSGIGTSTDFITGYVGGLGDSSTHDLNFKVNTTGILTFQICASSESGYDYGHIIKNGAAALGSVTGSSCFTSTVGVSTNDTIMIRYYKDSSDTAGLDRVSISYLYVAPPPAPPTLASISPNTGTTAGGTSVTLTGTNLTGATAVTIGGIAATNVSVVNSTTITAVTAAGGAAGVASVLVTTPGGTNAANTLFTWTTPSVSAYAAPQNMGVLYGYDGSQPKYNVRVHWDANSNPNFRNYEVAYRISGGAWVTETTRAYQIYSWPGNALYSYNFHGSAMLYKKQFNPGTNYEFRVRSWYISATPVGVDEYGDPDYNVSSDWSTTSVSLPATPGALTTAARFKGISYEYRPYRAEQYYSQTLINNADTYDATLSVLPVADRFMRSTNYQYREYRTPDQIQLGWTTLNPSDSYCLPDFTCLVVKNLSPSKTYEVRMQTWFKSSTLVDNGDYMYYPDNPTAPEWVTTTVTTPASLVGGGAPSNFSVASTTRLDDENYPLRTYNLSWATPSTTTNSSWIVLWYEIQTASSFYGSTQDYEIATLWAPPRYDVVPTVQIFGSNSFSIGEFDHMQHNTFRVRAVYGYLTTDYDCDGLCFRVPKEYSPWAYFVQ